MTRAVNCLVILCLVGCVQTATAEIDSGAELFVAGREALLRGDLDEAERQFQDILNGATDRGVLQARSLSHLATVERERGKSAEARRQLDEALAIFMEVAPNHQGVGDVYNAQGDLKRAEAFAHQALGISRRLAPGTLREAEGWANLVMIYIERSNKSTEEEERTKFLEMARAASLEGVDIIEGQITRARGSGVGSAQYRGLNQRFYQMAGDLHLLREPRDTATAFHVQERSRAHGFLSLLAEREMLHTVDVPTELDEERRFLAVRYDALLNRMLTDTVAPKVEGSTDYIHQLRLLERRRDRVRDKIRATSPRLASLRYAAPHDVEAVRSSLDPGTLLLSYSRGLNGVGLRMFVLGHAVEPTCNILLSQDKTELAAKIQRFHEQIHGPDREHLEASRDALARWFYDQLIAPAEDAIASADRVVIVADGALHRLPFAALVRPDGQYLVEWKPIHFVLSATVYAQLMEDRPSKADTRSIDLAVFGDPRYPGQDIVTTPEKIGDARLRSAVERGFFDFEPLPHSRQEAASLGFAGRENNQVGVQANALEDLPGLKQAVVAPFDEGLGDRQGERRVERQAVVDGGVGGEVQNADVFAEGLDVFLGGIAAEEDAHPLLGEKSSEQLDGEGIIGLTRAFQYAGARSVASSLWKVSDAATAELMTRFYRHLRAGKTKDEALRSAQVELIRGEAGPEMTAPYAWAAFQLIGDWR